MAWSHSEEQKSLCPPPLPDAGKLESSPLWTLHLRGGWKPAEQLQAPGSVQTTEPALPQAPPGGTTGLRRREPTECQASRQEPCYVAPGHLVLVPAAHQVAAQGGPYKPRVAVRKVQWGGLPAGVGNGTPSCLGPGDLSSVWCALHS